MKLKYLRHQIVIPDKLLKEELPIIVREALELLIRISHKDEVSYEQTRASKIATNTRIKKSQRKITDAINLLRLENKNINCNSVAVISGCSINTVKKYKEMIDIQNKIMHESIDKTKDII
jgi:hypothetical protein